MNEACCGSLLGVVCRHKSSSAHSWEADVALFADAHGLLLTRQCDPCWTCASCRQMKEVGAAGTSQGSRHKSELQKFLQGVKSKEALGGRYLGRGRS